MRKVWLLVVTAAWLAGCASAMSLTPELSAAEASIRTAREAGAGSDVDALVYLSFAQRELADARLLLKLGDRGPARGLSLRARADADVATTIAHTIAARKAARKTLDEADLLHQELEKPLPLPDPSTGVRPRDSEDPQHAAPPTEPPRPKEKVEP